MLLHRRNALAWVCASAAISLATLAAQAQEVFPNRPVRIVVPYPAGGGSDVQARSLAEPMGKTLGQTVVVDNKPGASGAIGTQAVAAGPADGYSMVLANNGLLITPFVNKQTGYDPKDLIPVGVVSTTPMILVTDVAFPARTVKEFIDYVKAQPNGVEYGSAGMASYGHLATAQFADAAGLKMVHIPYKGEAPMTLALRAGEVKAIITAPSAAIMGGIQAGQLKVLGVASAAPSPLFPGVRLISETVPGFTAEVWFALFAPAATPPEALRKLSDALGKALATTDVKDKLANMRMLPGATNAEVFQKSLREESRRWAEIVPRLALKEN